MKKALLALAAVALLFATSCKKESINPAVDVPEGSFLATIDNGANPQNAPAVKDGMGTMTTIDANRYVIWEAGDQISINGSIYTTNTSDNSVVFSGGNATGTTFHAFYPASIAGTDAAGTLPATQTIELDGNNNITVRNLPMYANSTNNQLTFHNICAALKITVPVACNSIVVSANENICGEFTVDATNFAAQLAETGEHLGNSVTVTRSTGSFAANDIIYVAVPANTYHNFTIQCKDGDGSVVPGYAKIIDEFTFGVNKVYNLTLTAASVSADGFSFTYVKKSKSNCTIKVEPSDDVTPDWQITLETRTYTASTEAYTNWTTYTVGTNIVLNNVGDKVYFRAGSSGNTTVSYSKHQYYKFMATDSVEVSGNIMYLLNGTNPPTDFGSAEFVFYHLFDGMSTLISAENLVLPATTLATRCYQGMFTGCSNLVSAPTYLPAQTLAFMCYSEMFYNCTKLVNIPQNLPATTLPEACYAHMFTNCKITKAPAMTVNYLGGQQTCLDMFGGCSELTDISGIKLNATTLTKECYAYMFNACSKLQSAPELPAGTLVTKCYVAMFSSCSKLSSVKMMATNNLTIATYQQPLELWLSNAGTAQGCAKKIYVANSTVATWFNTGGGTTYAYNWTAEEAPQP